MRFIILTAGNKILGLRVLLKEGQQKKEEINPKYPPLHGLQEGFAPFP
jgi:hypothetical protein